MSTSKTLYNATEVKKVRQVLLAKQKGLDALTGLPIPDKQEVLDHDHKTQYVRGVLHRQTNAVLGKLENLYIRYLSWWYSGSLSDFLRKAAEYIEKEHPKEYVHPGWIKSVTTQFRKLKSKDKDILLSKLGIAECKNDLQRVNAFKKYILQSRPSFDTIQSYLNKLKE